MNQKIKIGNLTVDCFFNEYNKATKTQKQIPCPEISRQDRAAIDRGLDDTDFGEFFRFEDGNKIVTGMFNVIDSHEDELG
jgi:hypothetical protein